MKNNRILVMRISIKTDSRTKEHLYEFLMNHEDVINVREAEEEYDFIIESENYEILMEHLTSKFPILYYDISNSITKG